MILLLPLTFHQQFNKAQTWHTLCVFFLKQKFKKLYVYFWLHYVFVAACGLSLVAVSGGYSLTVVHGLLTAVSCLVAEHRL